MLDDGEVQRRLGYHPATDTTRPAYEMNRSAAILVAELWNRALPPGRETALALTALQEALMWANAAVACNAGPGWELAGVDVSEQLDDLAEHLEGPLHLRSKSVGGGGPVEGPNGGEIGPETGEIVPDEGISATSLDPEIAQQLLERQGTLGPADDIARRARGETVTLDQLAAGDALDQRIGQAVSARIGPVEPVEGADRLLHGDCLERVPGSSILRCERTAGHDGTHVRGDAVWS